MEQLLPNIVSQSWAGLTSAHLLTGWAEVLPPAEVEVVRVRTAAAESWQGGGIILIKLS